MNKLPEKEASIANAVIRCLRVWKERNHPRELILHSEDIDQLADWAKEMSELWDLNKKFCEDHGFPYKIIPEKIRRHP
jgi:hypothetical protein